MRALAIALVLVSGLLPLTAARSAETRHDSIINGVRLTWWSSRPIRPGDVPVLFLHGGPGYSSHSFRMTAVRA